VDQNPVASREKKSEFAGVGCVLQGVGLLAPFVLGALLGVFGVVVGVIALIVLFFLGSAKSSRWICGSCKNPLASKDVQMCAVCKAHLR